MSAKTKIEWSDRTWNPVVGCDRVSPGCDRCYAMNGARIRQFNPNPKIAAAYADTTVKGDGGVDWSGTVNLLPERLMQPLGWRRPQRVFVDSMSDLFHQAVPDPFISQVFAIMALTPRHTYQVLTKRHARMRSILSSPFFQHSVLEWTHRLGGDWPCASGHCDIQPTTAWPLPNLHIGVSVENQTWADTRIPALLETPASHRFLSCEPLLGPLNLDRFLLMPCPCCGGEPHEDGCIPCGNAGCDSGFVRGIHWVIAGGESGQGARPMHPDWARALRDTCIGTRTPFLFKQWGTWVPLGPLYGDLAETDDGHLEAVGLEVIEGKAVVQFETDGYIAEGHQPADPRTWLMGRVGKTRAGRDLDGRTWDQFPDTTGARR